MQFIHCRMSAVHLPNVISHHLTALVAHLPFPPRNAQQAPAEGDFPCSDIQCQSAVFFQCQCCRLYSPLKVPKDEGADYSRFKLNMCNLSSKWYKVCGVCVFGLKLGSNSVAVKNGKTLKTARSLKNGRVTVDWFTGKRRRSFLGSAHKVGRSAESALN